MVLLALTELAAEVAIWTLKKTVTYSWRGLWWGISKCRGTDEPTDQASAELRETVQKLQRQVEQQEEELAKLKMNI